ncbi:MAG: hypothetical protein ABL982_20950 [Vicinamibacterales bacterium]
MPCTRLLISSTGVRTLVLALAVAAAASACQQPDSGAQPGAARPKGTDQLKPEYDAAGKLTKLEYDRNNDGKMDAWGYMDGSRIVRIEVDENSDGTVDRWEYHKDVPPGSTAPAGTDPTLDRIERATNFNGTVNRREYFTAGALTKIEEDTDYNGTVDKWETYVNGSLSVTAFDTQGRGTPDRRMLYHPDGTFDHVESDPTGSGTFTRVAP